MKRWGEADIDRLQDAIESALTRLVDRPQTAPVAVENGEAGQTASSSETVACGDAVVRNTVSSTPAANHQASETQASVIVAEVLDTHHPHLRGRVLVRWFDPTTSTVTEQWLQRERHLSLHAGDQVLLTLPVGWTQWVVTGALGREAEAPVSDERDERSIHLNPGETVCIESHDGQRLLTIRQGASGPVFELGRGNVELSATQTLRLSADTIELSSGSGGTDLRSDGDTIVRSRTIRLN